MKKLLGIKKPNKPRDFDLIFFNEDFMIYRLQYRRSGDGWTEIMSVLIEDSGTVVPGSDTIQNCLRTWHRV